MTPDVGVRGTWGAFFAATVLVIVGTLGSLQGIAGIANGSFYVEPKDYWYTTSAATWGWTQLVVGLVVLAAGIGVFMGAAWARWLGIVVVSIQLVENFLFVPYQPFWSLLLIFIDLWIIHSLFVYRSPQYR